MKKNASNITPLSCDDTCVENTNSESLLSKLSVIENGYRVDPFLRIFRAKNQSEVKHSFRSAAINRGYLARLVALECTLEKYILICSSIGIKHQVLSLGAGYDSLYFRLRNQGVLNPKYCSYYEVDFPVVPRTKWRIIYNNVLLKSLFKSSTSYFDKECFLFDGGIFNMIGCNMTDTDNLEYRLNALEFDWNKLTIVFCECSLTYVEANQSIALTSWLTRKVPSMVFVDYEQICPFDSFGQIMVRHFKKRNSALKCVEYYPTVHDHMRRFLSLGWNSCHILDIDTIFRHNCGLQEIKRWQEFGEQFDEQEEFKCKCYHYIILVGSNSNLLSPMCLSKKSIVPKKCIQDSQNLKIISSKCVRVYEVATYNLATDILARLGHCIWRTPDKGIVIFGGYSKNTFRDSTLTVLGKDQNGFFLNHRSTFPSKETLFSAAAQLETYSVYIFGGRSSPDKASNKLYTLDPNGLNIREVVCANKRPEARWKHTLNALPHDRLILIGGKIRDKYFSDVHIYDIRKSLWKLVMKLPCPIYSHSTCSWIDKGKNCDKIVVSGGLDAYGNIQNQIYILSIDEYNKVTVLLNIIFFGSFLNNSHTLPIFRC